ncbi:DUF411 domain-containing protein [Roseomonas sp. E05]|uniref:DUF411 domain-containing protein n=1 Tax=Roseomonas sp. E05 TaxID=3046310 RepID=UPI0024BBE88F|nr:DUF411 domain-containing protein [Roseomonas sp. E05]MDJ0391629.1 DUF411 domain-containing protein [Roseomonas sp. E05]
MRRRSILGGALGLGLPLLGCSGTPKAEIWRDANCGCCGGWVGHLRAEGFAVEDKVVEAVGPYRQALGTPPDLISCHAGRIGGWAMEGHVPVPAIRRLLRERPSEVSGLAVPEMPVGVPGMEMPGAAPPTYAVLAFSPDGAWRVWMSFRGLQPV